MLPKEEKIKKKSIDSDQPGLFDKEDEKKQLAAKRRFVYIAMFLTIGLSIFFWIYRSVKSFDFSLKIPIISLPFLETKSSPIKNTSDFSLPKDSNSTWSVFVKDDTSGSIIFQKNQDLIFNSQNLDSISEKINQSDFISSSEYSSSLPQGLKIKEITLQDDKNFSYFSKIITPSQNLTLLIKISDSQNLDSSKKLISNLIDQLYWSSLQK